MNSYIDYTEDLHRRLRDPERALGFLNACLDDHDDQGIFLDALRDVAEAQGGLRPLSRKTKLNREHLFRMLSKGGNPTLSSLLQLVRALGYKLELKPA